MNINIITYQVTLSLKGFPSRLGLPHYIAHMCFSLTFHGRITGNEFR